jgi:prepilin-type N-terminal cleavage/methylation domain-containing protein
MGQRGLVPRTVFWAIGKIQFTGMAARMMNPFSPRRGYTLVEVVLALAVIAVVAGMAVPALRGWRELAALRGPADELARLVHQARARAFAENQKYLITLNEKFFALRAVSAKEGTPDLEQIALPPDFTCSVKGLGQREWEPLRNRTWIFAPGDFAEPLSLRFQRRDQVLTQRYDPLSAMVADEEIFVP